MTERRHITIRKVNPAGGTELTWQGELIEDTESWLKIKAPFDLYDRIDLGYVVLERGDRFVEWFFKNRWYTIYEIYANKSTTLKGWYCNITKPVEIIENEVTTVDMALDLWVSPNGAMSVLDESEFGALEISSNHRTAACDAMEDLQRLVRSHQPPFDQLGAVEPA